MVFDDDLRDAFTAKYRPCTLHTNKHMEIYENRKAVFIRSFLILQ